VHILRKTIMSLINQTLKPHNIYLYLSKSPYLLDTGFTSIPEWLRFLPVSVKFVENTGPFRKLLPLLKEKWDSDEIIITVDDDTVYSPNLVENMVSEYKNSGKCVACRAFYLEDVTCMNLSKFEANHLNNFHTGKGAVLYHPSMFKQRIHPIHTNGILGSDYLTLCKTSDDIWFNLWRIYNNIECVAIMHNKYMIHDLTNPRFALYKNYNDGEEGKNKSMYENTYKFIFEQK
jgi:hypothetical protein